MTAAQLAACVCIAAVGNLSCRSDGPEADDVGEWLSKDIPPKPVSSPLLPPGETNEAAVVYFCPESHTVQGPDFQKALDLLRKREFLQVAQNDNRLAVPRLPPGTKHIYLVRSVQNVDPGRDPGELGLEFLRGHLWVACSSKRPPEKWRRKRVPIFVVLPEPLRSVSTEYYQNVTIRKRRRSGSGAK